MDEFRISDEIYDQIKDFEHNDLTKEQKLSVTKIIPSEIYENYYKKYGLCKECKQIKTYFVWCKICNSKHFKENFKNWTSGNDVVDKFIQESQLNSEEYWQVLEWIDYNQFIKIKYVAKGGFGTVYTAIWKEGYISSWDNKQKTWNRDKQNHRVALKSLDSSQTLSEFSKEVKFHLQLNSFHLIKIYGISQDPNTKNYIMVMDYANRGSLRNFLNENYHDMTWRDKILYLSWIITGLKEIHDEEIIHQDFHSGNILVKDTQNFCISDLGLCKKNDDDDGKNQNKEVFGVLPYVAPEVLKGQKYTKASDIYSFGIICYEVITGLPPYHDMSHGIFLAQKVFNGFRPNFKNYNVPQLIIDIIEECWNGDPLKRPSTDYVYQKFIGLFVDIDRINRDDEIETEIIKQCNQADKLNEKISKKSSTENNSLSYETHPQAIYTSRLLDFKNSSKSENNYLIQDTFEFDISEFDEDGADNNDNET